LASKLFLRDIYIFLWTLLFIIPGIIKSYEYYYVDNILVENPEMSLSDAIRISKEMSFGEKMDLFILDLSFIGWALLSILTLGLGFLFLHPYTYATNARLYLFKKDLLTFHNNHNYYNDINNM
ncbi:DUF975 family protein, partial [Peptostreptococcaceae bacterium OttesenSCG-928-C18]|nr:DUF975 family protein [Peptostreptococcaceae bacterium OttesenSCG-928-C18]